MNSGSTCDTCVSRICRKRLRVRIRSAQCAARSAQCTWTTLMAVVISMLSMRDLLFDEIDEQTEEIRSLRAYIHQAPA